MSPPRWDTPLVHISCMRPHNTKLERSLKLVALCWCFQRDCQKHVTVSPPCTPRSFRLCVSWPTCRYNAYCGWVQEINTFRKMLKISTQFRIVPVLLISPVMFTLYRDHVQMRNKDGSVMVATHHAYCAVRHHYLIMGVLFLCPSNIEADMKSYKNRTTCGPNPIQRYIFIALIASCCTVH